MPSVAAPSYQSIAAAKRTARDALLPADSLLPAKLALAPADSGALNVTDVPARSGVLSASELAVTELDAGVLVGKLAKGELTSVDVTTAFVKRSSIAQQLTNCLTEICYDDALAHAAELDAYLAKEGKTVGPLHGLPVSIKDCFKIKGLDTTIGFIAWCNEPMETESVMVSLLRKAGAVLYVKTNVSCAMMMAESYNNVWDYTVNPFNRACTAGGSSGGEGALLALKGAPIGVGTDIGGSIRIPASLNGLYSLKPSFGRFPTHATRSGLPGQEMILSINGPMSSSLAGVELFAKTVVDSQPWLQDPRMLPIPWREVALPAKLNVGVIYDDGTVRPTPPVLRALKATVDALTAAGHSVAPFPLPKNHARAPEILNEGFLADGGSNIKKIIAEGAESWPKGLQQYADRDEPFSATRMWELQAERNELNKELCDQWNATSSLTPDGRPFDVILSPVTAYAGVAKYEFAYVGYTGVWNIADYAATTFPTGLFVDQALDGQAADFTPRNKDEQAVHGPYDPAKIADCPISLQLVGRRLEEEKVVAITGVVAAALKAAAL